MQYFKIGAGKFIQFDELTNSAKIIVKSELQNEKAELTARIGAVDPNLPKTNAEWIAWAKAHYDYVDHSQEQAELDRIQAILDIIKDL
jgi:hypothetical protein